MNAFEDVSLMLRMLVGQPKGKSLQEGACRTRTRNSSVAKSVLLLQRDQGSGPNTYIWWFTPTCNSSPGDLTSCLREHHISTTPYAKI